MAVTLYPEVQSCIIPYTLILTSQEENDVIERVKSFIANLTISKSWSELSLNCDFREVFSYAGYMESPILCTNLLKYVKVQRVNYANRMIECSIFPLIKEVDLIKVIKLGVDVNSIESLLLEQGFKQNWGELILLLLKKGSLDPKSGFNYPIKWASENGHLELVEVLLEQEGVDPTADYNYAIQWASENGHLEVVKLLLERVGVQGAQIALAGKISYPEVRKVLTEYIQSKG